MFELILAFGAGIGAGFLVIFGMFIFLMWREEVELTKRCKARLNDAIERDFRTRVRNEHPHLFCSRHAAERDAEMSRQQDSSFVRAIKSGHPNPHQFRSPVQMMQPAQDEHDRRFEMNGSSPEMKVMSIHIPDEIINDIVKTENAKRHQEHNTVGTRAFPEGCDTPYTSGKANTKSRKKSSVSKTKAAASKKGQTKQKRSRKAR